MTRALVIVDLQNDFIDGSLPVPGGAEVAQRITDMDLSGYDYIVTTQDWHIEPGDHWDKWPKHCEAYTNGAALYNPIKVIGVDLMIHKGHYDDGYSGFEGRGYNGVTLLDFLLAKKVTGVDIVGLALDHCVGATALDAAENGFRTTVLLDYTASVGPSEKTITNLREAGVTVS